MARRQLAVNPLLSEIIPSFRDGPQNQTRNLEIPASRRSLSSGRPEAGPVGRAPE